MNNYRKAIIGIAVILSGATALWAADDLLQDRALEYPTGYRDTFTEYFRGDRLFEHDQVIRIYANDVALDGAKLDGMLPYGSVLVAELFTTIEDEDGDVKESAIGRRISGPMKAIAVMERQSGWDEQYPEELKVGDWEFDLFSTAGENLNKDMTACRACHNPLSDSEFVFSLEHLIAAQP
ncbi:MAG: cytochrome P460 family protein [Litoreibacter sp.]|uniref:cytochrome P460 family protein n=1 Tax=Litoreibacter sp. TaxID=1969459 RepID=UPI003299829E